ncbi:hypothetical protein O7599_22190 [Streptomyces sp. WMMC500]|uniref:hypothetical protein n=1 Tax=Streptomyces sp. WMMC500 TaxID=3015154 RepID=UPI00248B1BDC|nr:hypothetical protein [Streptomyces sp. WMMC500]WBB58342.1 hypothetical protein O7599_22190 [Streptomyces sp. WMMC500]
MSELSLLQTADVPFAALTDFHLVTTGTGPLLVGTHPDGACTWDPLRDRWAEHRLDSPWPPGEEDGPAAPSALRALVVGGRIVVGGGSEDLRFAQWDLASGEVRAFADDDDFDVETVGSLELPGRSLFLVSPDAEAVALWDVGGDGTAERIAELNARCDRTAATGMLGHRPVLVTADEDGGPLQVWDLNDRVPLVGFDKDLETAEGEESLLAVGLAEVGGRPHVVAAGGGGSVVLGDVDSGEWGAPFAGCVPQDETDMLVDTGTANGVPIAVTCTYDPYPAEDFTSVLRAWDLEGGHARGGPVAAHEGGALGVQLTELEGRTVAVTVGRGDGFVRVWALDG